ncbi:MAG: alcohol dehydrogenase catalytic domain-containing protein [Sedimentisphaerales bacterium]|nr:alcohol dehydrogenase catalytic domain-containing protein [Sedimentisphaerales bacterium]
MTTKLTQTADQPKATGPAASAPAHTDNLNQPSNQSQASAKNISALVYNVSPIGWATCKWLSKIYPPCLFSKINGISLRNIPTPQLPADDWVRVRTLLGGICGTDLAIIAQKQPPNSILQCYSSMPMLLGHENLAVVESVGPKVDPEWIGRRVCVEPTLGCQARGIQPPCPPCTQGAFGACENFSDNASGSAQLPPGTSIGYNNRTGGSYGSHFVAHQSQLIPVPDSISDEQAVLTDPAACALHAVLRADLKDVQQILVCGAGVLGLAIIACLRAIGCTARIDALDRGGYLKNLACQLGADKFLLPPKNKTARFELIAQQTKARIQRSRFGNLMLDGGYDIVFDCVGSTQTINESLKWTAARGQFIMVGTGHGGKLDLTPIWFRELSIKGAYGRQFENYNHKTINTYALVHELITAGKLDLTPLLTHRFSLNQYRQALNVAINKAKHQAIKVAFDFR